MTGTVVTGQHYELRAIGLCPERARAELPRLDVYVHSVETVLHCPVSDGAALGDLLAVLDGLGIDVVELHQVAGDVAASIRSSDPDDPAQRLVPQNPRYEINLLGQPE